jgi:hypothetical protein
VAGRWSSQALSEISFLEGPLFTSTICFYSLSPPVLLSCSSWYMFPVIAAQMRLCLSTVEDLQSTSQVLQDVTWQLAVLTWAKSFPNLLFSSWMHAILGASYSWWPCCCWWCDHTYYIWGFLRWSPHLCEPYHLFAFSVAVLLIGLIFRRTFGRVNSVAL